MPHDPSKIPVPIKIATADAAPDRLFVSQEFFDLEIAPVVAPITPAYAPMAPTVPSTNAIINAVAASLVGSARAGIITNSASGWSP